MRNNILLIFLKFNLLEILRNYFIYLIILIELFFLKKSHNSETPHVSFIDEVVELNG